MADTRCIIESRGHSVCEGIKLELRNGVNTSSKEGAEGATRFSADVGRHLDFKNI